VRQTVKLWLNFCVTWRSSVYGVLSRGSVNLGNGADPSCVPATVTVGRLIGGVPCSSANAGAGSKNHMHMMFIKIIAHLRWRICWVDRALTGMMAANGAHADIKRTEKGRTRRGAPFVIGRSGRLCIIQRWRLEL
jgi:hypothetical protein